MKRPFLRVDSGDNKGKTFVVPPEGLRLGRSSSNDIHITDEELSRNHCLIEQDGEFGIRITDLASANGTYVNGKTIGSEAYELKVGDTIKVGTSYISVLSEDNERKIVKTINGSLDLGLSKKDDEMGYDEATIGPEKKPKPRPEWMNIVWAAVIVLFVGALALVLMMPREEASAKTPVAVAAKTEAPKIVSDLHYEKVIADSSKIVRYDLVFEDGLLKLAFDDVPEANRHIQKKQKLSSDSLASLSEIIVSSKLNQLEKDYFGESAEQINELTSYIFKAHVGSKYYEVIIENSVEPDEFQEFREMLETFVNNELKVWAMQYDAKTLIETAKKEFEIGDSKFDEADVALGNIAEAIMHYKTALQNLDTINPKPEWFSRLREQLKAAEAELNVRYRDLHYEIDRAKSLKLWEEAREKLMELREILVDKNDQRYKDATVDQIYVEKRIKDAKKPMKKGGRK